jgi:hypothetical protein
VAGRLLRQSKHYAVKNKVTRKIITLLINQLSYSELSIIYSTEKERGAREYFLQPVHRQMNRLKSGQFTS